MAAFTAADRRTLAAKGQAMPDGSYPIRNKADLLNAARDWARTGKTAPVKAWIEKRAKTLGISLDSLPGMADSEGPSDEPAARDEMEVAMRRMKQRSANPPTPSRRPS